MITALSLHFVHTIDFEQRCRLKRHMVDVANWLPHVGYKQRPERAMKVAYTEIRYIDVGPL